MSDPKPCLTLTNRGKDQCPRPAAVMVKVGGDPYTEFTFCRPHADDFYDPEAGDSRYEMGAWSGCITCEREDGSCLVGNPTLVAGDPTPEHFRFDVIYAQVGA